MRETRVSQVIFDPPRVMPQGGRVVYIAMEPPCSLVIYYRRPDR